jgi:NADH:ubiquinone oxidoreductase subunit C
MLSRARFGRGDTPLVWVAGAELREVATLLREDSELNLNWLEHLTAMQVDETLVLTYFLCSTEHRTTLALRTMAVPSASGEKVEVPSVQALWPMAAALEGEVGELFGIRFQGASCRARWLGAETPRFPLRKSVPAAATGAWSRDLPEGAASDRHDVAGEGFPGAEPGLPGEAFAALADGGG